MKMSKEDHEYLNEFIASLDFVTALAMAKLMEDRLNYHALTCLLRYVISHEKLNTEKAIRILQSVIRSSPGLESVWEKVDSEKVLEYFNFVAKIEETGPDSSVKDNTIDGN